MYRWISTREESVREWILVHNPNKQTTKHTHWNLYNNKHGGESSENQTRNQTREMIQAKKSTGADYLSTKCEFHKR